MFSSSMLNAMVTFGYIAGAVGFISCVIAYFAIPKIIKNLTGGSNDKNIED